MPGGVQSGAPPVLAGTSTIYSAAAREALPVTVVPLAPNIVVANRLLVRTIPEQTFRDRGGVILADLSAVHYVDASGLDALVTARKTIRRDGGDLELALLNEELRTLFELTKARHAVPDLRSRAGGARQDDTRESDCRDRRWPRALRRVHRPRRPACCARKNVKRPRLSTRSSTSAKRTRTGT